MRLAATLLKLPIHVYRWTLKPLVGHYCRHWPTCSEYGLQAIDTNGAWRGFWLTTSRVIRCGPGGTSGVDPVPDIREHSHALAPWRYGRWRGVNEGPSQERMTSIIKTIMHPDGKRRVSIIRHPSGLYGFENEYLSEPNPDDYPGHKPVWCPLRGGSFSMCDAPDTAEREARERVDWLKSQVGSVE